MTPEEIAALKRADLNKLYAEALEKMSLTADERVTKLEEANAALQTQIDEQIEKENSLENEKEELISRISEKDELISQLNKRVSQLDSKVSNTRPVVEFDGKKFEVAIPRFKHNGVVINADDLSNLPDVVKELVEMKSGVLKLVAE